MRSNLSLQVKATDILAECDKLRDITLPDLGVLLEDKEGEETVIKLVDKLEMELMGEVTRETTSPSLQRGMSGNVTICDSQNVEKGISKMHQFTWNHCNCNHRELC